MQHNEIIRLYDHSPLMKRKLEQGISLVVDRYAFSGAAFTSAKPVSLLLAFQTLLTSYHITVCVCVCVCVCKEQQTCHDMFVSFRVSVWTGARTQMWGCRSRTLLCSYSSVQLRLL